MKKLIVLLAAVCVLLTGCGEAPEVTEFEQVTPRVCELVMCEPETYFTGIGNGIVISEWPTHSLTKYLYFYDTNTGEYMGIYEIPEKFLGHTGYSKGEGDELLELVMKRTDYTQSPPKYFARAMHLYKDFSYEIDDDCGPADFASEVCGHKLAKWDLDIIDVESGEVILQGYRPEGDENYDHTTEHSLKFELDENRFLYRTSAYNSDSKYSIYDFRTGTSTEVPGLSDYYLIGCHDGRIYSISDPWYSDSNNLFVTDTETLETTVFMEPPFEIDPWYDSISYHMPSSGEYIIAYKPACLERETIPHPAWIYKINPETARIEAMYELPEEYHFTAEGTMIDGDVFMILCDTEEKLLMVDIE